MHRLGLLFVLVSDAVSSTDGTSAHRLNCRHGDRSTGRRPSWGDRHGDEQGYGRVPRRPVRRGRHVLRPGVAARRLRRRHRALGFPADGQSRRCGHRRHDHRQGHAAGEHQNGGRHRHGEVDDGGLRHQPGARRRRADTNRKPSVEWPQLHEPRRAPTRRDGDPWESVPVQLGVHGLRSWCPGVAHGDYCGRRERPQPGGRQRRPELLAGSGAGISDLDHELRPVNGHRGIRGDQHRYPIGHQSGSRRRVLLLPQRKHRGLSEPRSQSVDGQS